MVYEQMEAKVCAVLFIVEIATSIICCIPPHGRSLSSRQREVLKEKIPWIGVTDMDESE